MACPIQCETYTDANPAVVCPACKADACTKCTKRYLLEAALDPHCMSCRVAWSPEFIEGAFTAAFVKGDLRKHIIALLAERERAHFPRTLLLLEYEEAERAYDEAKAQADALMRQVKRSTADHTAPMSAEAVAAYNDHVPVLSDARALRARLGTACDAPAAEERQHTVRPCPVTGCAGFLSSAWKCAACAANVCAHCEAIKPRGDDGNLLPHTCDPAELATVEAKRKESKPCPKCGTYVSKVSGCNQMWCTACNTPFDWSTLRIITSGIVHNPHYFEWRDREAAGRAPAAAAAADDPCALGWPWETPSAAGIYLGAPHYGDFRAVFQLMIEIWDIHIQHQGYEYDPEHYLDLRKLRVRGQIDEKTWRIKLSIRETHRKKKQAQYRVLMALLAASRDVMHQFRARALPLAVAYDHLRQLRTLANDALAKQRRGMITSRWAFEPILYEHAQ